MLNQLILGASVIVATAAFVWLAESILTIISWPFVRAGVAVHKLLHSLPHNESDAWLFILLVGVTRVLIIAVGSAVFAFSLALLLLPIPAELGLLRDIMLNGFVLLLLIRLVSLFMGAVVIGSSVRTLLGTLKG